MIRIEPYRESEETEEIKEAMAYGGSALNNPCWYDYSEWRAFFSNYEEPERWECTWMNGEIFSRKVVVGRFGPEEYRGAEHWGRTRGYRGQDREEGYRGAARAETDFDYRDREYKAHKGRGPISRGRGGWRGTRGHREEGRYRREDRIKEPAPPEARGVAWAGSHPQPFPKLEDSQIGKTRVNKNQNEKNVLFDLGNDMDFPPLIKERTKEEKLEDFSFMLEDENSTIEQGEETVPKVENIGNQNANARKEEKVPKVENNEKDVGSNPPLKTPRSPNRKV